MHYEKIFSVIRVPYHSRDWRVSEFVINVQPTANVAKALESRPTDWSTSRDQTQNWGSNLPSLLYK